jgi:ribosomal protein S27E
MTKIAGGHLENIQCPECQRIQAAEVMHTPPHWTYVHHCTGCGYTIMESEWYKID